MYRTGLILPLLQILLLLSAVTTTHAQLQPLQQPQQQQLRQLQTSSSNQQVVPAKSIGDPCNRRNPCQEGLTCTRTPSLLGFLEDRKVCFPLPCISNAVKTFDEQVNMTHYQQTIFAKAHVTPDEFFLRNQRRRRRPMTSYGAAKDMLQATPVQKVMQTIRQNPIDRQQWNAYEQSLQNCDPEFKLSTPNNNNNAISALLARGPSQRGILGLAGFGGEVGAILGGEVEFFFAYPNATPVFFIHIGGGLLAGIDAGVTATLGMAFTGEPADIPGVGFELDLQIPIPIVGPGVSVGVDINNVWDLTFNLNLGVGIAIGGFSAGYTWGFPENDPSTGGANFTTTAAAAAANSSNSGASGSIGGL